MTRDPSLRNRRGFSDNVKQIRFFLIAVLAAVLFIFSGLAEGPRTAPTEEFAVEENSRTALELANQQTGNQLQSELDLVVSVK